MVVCRVAYRLGRSIVYLICRGCGGVNKQTQLKRSFQKLARIKLFDRNSLPSANGETE